MAETKLWEALDELRSGGWTKFQYARGRKHCAVGAIAKVNKLRGRRILNELESCPDVVQSDLEALSITLNELYPLARNHKRSEHPISIVIFNDDDNRTFDEIEQVFEKAAIRREEQI